MKKYIAHKILRVNGQPSPCECTEDTVCAYCVQANLILLENPPKEARMKKSSLSVGCNCRQYGFCMECQEKMELKESPIFVLQERIKLTSLRTVARELGVSHPTVTSWIHKGIVPEKYFKDGELVGNCGELRIIKATPQKTYQKT